jgi:hypothetical protein
MKRIIQNIMLALFIVQEKLDVMGIKRHRFVIWNPLSYLVMVVIAIGVMFYGAFKELLGVFDYNPFKWT